jgi:hypothetical protein
MVTMAKKKKLFYGDGPAIDFRGHLAVELNRSAEEERLKR